VTREGNEKRGIKKERRKKNGTVQNFGHTAIVRPGD
jgi:hypothetical protein